jgi:hypothetical protein
MLKAQEEEPPGDFHNHDEFLYFWTGLSLTTKPKRMQPKWVEELFTRTQDSSSTRDHP